MRASSIVVTADALALVVDTIGKRAVVGGGFAESWWMQIGILLLFYPRSLVVTSLSQNRHACGVVRNVCCDVSAAG